MFASNVWIYKPWNQIVNVQECNYCSGIGYVGGREKKTITLLRGLEAP